LANVTIQLLEYACRDGGRDSDSYPYGLQDLEHDEVCLDLSVDPDLNYAAAGVAGCPCAGYPRQTAAGVGRPHGEVLYAETWREILWV
jgi:hypothetical protein